jgi:hypothetical protein
VIVNVSLPALDLRDIAGVDPRPLSASCRQGRPFVSRGGHSHGNHLNDPPIIYAILCDTPSSMQIVLELMKAGTALNNSNSKGCFKVDGGTKAIGLMMNGDIVYVAVDPLNHDHCEKSWTYRGWLATPNQ